MPRVDFYVLPANTTPERFACDMAARVRRERLTLRIDAPNRNQAGALDDLLWTHRDISFLPHALADEAGAEGCPIRVAWPGAPALGGDVLINLAPEPAPDAATFARIVEPVGADDDAKAESRARYRRYRDLGWELASHTLEADRAES